MGRYIVIDLVGSGAMGQVYAAYDPELDRKVALKVMRGAHHEGEGRARILREAQAIAKLSHPNVVGVYDVGAYEDGVFIAMELVEGRTLALWIEEERPGWRRIVEVFVAAGRGLHAAHESGILHRDFKATNVLMGRDGKILVADFGLARRIGDADPRREGPLAADPSLSDVSGSEADTVPLRATAASTAEPPSTDDGAEESATTPGLREHQPVQFLNLDVTRTGVVLGTPAYMAPELVQEGSTDARSDQFSYCVALYEALYGVRPFSDPAAVRQAEITAGKLREPASSDVPGWVRRVIVRGLHVRPEERWPAVADLLAALESDPTAAKRQRVRRFAVGAGIVAMATAAVLGSRGSAKPVRPLCDGHDRVVEAWPVSPADPRRAAMRSAFLATGRSYAAEAFTGAARLADAYVAGWERMYRETCEATNVRGEQSAEVLDLRMGCLEQRVAAVKALGQVLADANATTVENAVGAAAALPSLARCADVPLLRAVVRPPDDPRVRARVEALRRQVGGVEALVDSGQCKVAQTRLDSLLADVRAVAYSPLSAQALNVAGRIGDLCGEPRDAVSSFKSAMWEAEAGHDDELLARVATTMAFLAGSRNRDLDAAEDWANFADAVLRRIGGHEILQAWSLVARGGIAEQRGDFAAALSFYQRSLEMKQRALGPEHFDTLISANNVVLGLANLGRYAEAELRGRRVIAGLESAIGSTHPFLALALNNYAEILNGLGRSSEAAALAARAIDVYRLSDADPYLLAFPLTTLGQSDLDLGRLQKARAALEEALAAREAKDPNLANLGETRFALARTLWQTPSERRRALDLARAAHADYARAPGRAARLAAVDVWLAAHRAP